MYMKRNTLRGKINVTVAGGERTTVAVNNYWYINMVCISIVMVLVN